jgi:hypothetical protein
MNRVPVYHSNPTLWNRAIAESLNAALARIEALEHPVSIIRKVIDFVMTLLTLPIRVLQRVLSLFKL